MKLRGIDFGHVFNASGARNFTGHGWPFHRMLRVSGLLNYDGSTFVSKTTTMSPRPGNLKLLEDGLTPQQQYPDCVIMKWREGIVLNAVGLSGRGAVWLLDHADIAALTKPFVLSFATVGKNWRERLAETRRFVSLIQEKRGQFHAPFALQINISCPNSEQDWLEAADESREMLTVAALLEVPLMLKINILMHVEVASQLASNPACDAIVCSNTIPFGALPRRISWKKLFGSEISPLAMYGGGGLSGKPLLPLVLEWIATARLRRFPKPIVACGGILSKRDAHAALNAGADAIELGSISMLRPWRVRGIIRSVNKRFARQGL